MSLFDNNSFRVPKTVAEIMVREKLEGQRNLTVPDMNFETMSKPTMEPEHPRFQRNARTNTLRGNDQCCHNP